MPNQRTCQRKLGELQLVSEDPPPNPHICWWPNRIVAGVFELEKLLTKLREVHAACFPDRGFVRIRVGNFYSRWNHSGTFPLFAIDTNRHGYDDCGETVGRRKSGASYKRPGHDLCSNGNVPIVWGYQSQDNMYASLPTGIVKAALSELEDKSGSRPIKIEVRVQMILMRRGDESVERTFMSWGLTA